MHLRIGALDHHVISAGTPPCSPSPCISTRPSRVSSFRRSTMTSASRSSESSAPFEASILWVIGRALHRPQDHLELAPDPPAFGVQSALQKPIRRKFRRRAATFCCRDAATAAADLYSRIRNGSYHYSRNPAGLNDSAPRLSVQRREPALSNLALLCRDRIQLGPMSELARACILRVAVDTNALVGLNSVTPGARRSFKDEWLHTPRMTMASDRRKIGPGRQTRQIDVKR
jgi:hypothetical protein